MAKGESMRIYNIAETPGCLNGVVLEKGEYLEATPPLKAVAKANNVISLGVEDYTYEY